MLLFSVAQLIRPVVNELQFMRTYSYEKFAKRAVEKYNHWLPLNPSPKLAEIVASLITDGHIQKKKDGKYTYVGYFSDDENDLNLFNNLLYEVFKERGRVRKWGIRVNGRSTACILCNSAMVRILSLCGAPLNDKIITKFSIPSWIKEGSTEIRTAFLRRSFTCEGSIFIYNYSRKWCVKYTMHKCEELIDDLIKYFVDLKAMLLSFGITCSINKGKSYVRKKDERKIIEMQLRIRGRESINAFYDKIGFDNDKKLNKLKFAVNNIGPLAYISPDRTNG